ncbi:MAG TPA: DUF1622 domain-containing protein [Candidatus Fimadaptatus faecigallinarum]|uniref:DUF1622 domain-containing protein n=1 Tax=Candidatus Fimadaptatus faecigallinarum TaxID=2840814 RepID=A0A9D1S5F9_9FIRM|nr:DUF1622 domain-containing protein [Candidatus Fimadaptatus faecigallinarum]
MTEFMSALESTLEIIITLSIHVLECMGISIILVGAFKAIYGLARRKPGVRLKLAESMALALEFKLGGEILRTVQVRAWSEIAIVGAIILLRGVLNLLIHHEIKIEEERDERMRALEAQGEPTAAQPAHSALVSTAQCVFPTPDPERTAHWYRQCLGYDSERDGDAIALSGEGARILLTPTQGSPVRPNRMIYGGGCDAVIRVRDVDALQRTLMAQGVMIPHALDRDGFVAEDADGRWLRFERAGDN